MCGPRRGFFQISEYTDIGRYIVSVTSRQADIVFALHGKLTKCNFHCVSLDFNCIANTADFFLPIGGNTANCCYYFYFWIKQNRTGGFPWIKPEFALLINFLSRVSQLERGARTVPTLNYRKLRGRLFNYWTVPFVNESIFTVRTHRPR